MGILEPVQKILKNTVNNSDIVFKSLPIDGPKAKRPDITRTKEILRWRPNINLEKKTKETVNYFKENRKGIKGP